MKSNKVIIKGSLKLNGLNVAMFLMKSTNINVWWIKNGRYVQQFIFVGRYTQVVMCYTAVGVAVGHRLPSLRPIRSKICSKSGGRSSMRYYRNCTSHMMPWTGKYFWIYWIDISLYRRPWICYVSTSTSWSWWSGKAPTLLLP